MVRHVDYSLVAVSFLHFINDANVLLVPTVLPLIIEEFSLSYTQVGFLTGMTAFAMMFLQLPLGYLSDIKGRKYLLSFGIFLVGLGALISGLSKTFLQLLAAQLLLGVGGSFYHPLGYSLTSGLYERGERGSALGIQSSMGDLGVLVIFLTNGYLALIGGWRLPLLVFGVLAIFSSLTPILIREDVQRVDNMSHRLRFKEVISKHVLSLLLMYFLVAAAYKILYSYLPPILMLKGLSLTVTNLTIAVATFFGIVGSITVGILIDKFGEGKILSFLSLVLSIFSLILVKVSNIFSIVFVVVVLGFCLYGLYPGLYSILSKKVRKHVLGLTYGFILSAGMSGGFIGTVMAGVAADIFNVEVTLLIFSFLILALFITLLIEELSK